MSDPTVYAEPDHPALPRSEFVLDRDHAALVITDPQVDFLSPDGASWPVFGDSVGENNTVAHIGELFDAAKQSGITVAVSPHYFYPTDKQWLFGDPLEKSWGPPECSLAAVPTRPTASRAPAPTSCPPTNATSTTGTPSSRPRTRSWAPSRTTSCSNCVSAL